MNIDKRALREVAEKATKGPWKVFSDIDTKTFSIHTPRDKRCENVIKWGRFDCQPNAEANAEFIAAFNPKVALALLDENIQLQREKDAIEAVALALRDDMRQARERLAAAEQERENWRISFDNERYRADKLAAALNAEREKLVMANRSLITQHTRANSAESRIAELEARTVCLPKLPVLGSTAERYEGFADGASSMRNECANAIHAAGIKVEGE
ncbi:ead/Ea22-like family protein [Salmonella enterica subsp. enterica]|uniref:Ead/Ea22-like family protein n=5 Tax=Salmonella enterica TaxID=28901 RepID=A0A5W6SUB2_SALET|nr:ead/Ea22-like family protein [Salmonella enterica]EBG6727482.1 ead/Ea22-like family protein [Salmonella enterica subsp. enterica]EBS3952855.1 ead/Ea22-like family protein [Salmonella enterica subsp. enterica serovar Augustenborg]EBZ9424512.1 ead/Ea22-like family protein [Salmonella enterica subsp. enterica serovar London]EDU1396250.1 ead/Ea22-like family protein [Salmonella enterica subsp. enterica serovar Lille]EDV3902590.1 ead/Ea22-like family protein [Salmonella enterica subsp. enterica 